MAEQSLVSKLEAIKSSSDLENWPEAREALSVAITEIESHEPSGSLHDYWLTAPADKLRSALEFQGAMTKVLLNSQERYITAFKQIRARTEDTDFPVHLGADIDQIITETGGLA